MYNILIHGPRYAVSGQTIYYDISDLIIPDDVQLSDVVIKWFKNDIEVKQYEDESQNQLDLYSVDKPAEGDYYAILSVDSKNIHIKSNIISLEIGTEWRVVEFDIDGVNDTVANIGDNLTIIANVISNTECFHSSCKWVKDGTIVSDNEKLEIVIGNDTVGEYTAIVTGQAHGGYTESTIEKSVSIQLQTTCRLIYIHDLRPARNTGFIQIGWWVHDEIIKAKYDNFAWQEDPFNSRFLYKCELAALSKGFSDYSDLEVQESRHGYILYRKDLIN